MDEKEDARLATLFLTGEYDIARREELARRFQSVSGEHPLVIDVSEGTYVDSTFLNELASLRLNGKGPSISISGVNEHIARLLETVSFDQLFDTLD